MHSPENICLYILKANIIMTGNSALDMWCLSWQDYGKGAEKREQGE